jgi:hypothetical protein
VINVRDDGKVTDMVLVNHTEKTLCGQKCEILNNSYSRQDRELQEDFWDCAGRDCRVSISPREFPHFVKRGAASQTRGKSPGLTRRRSLAGELCILKMNLRLGLRIM